MLLRGIYSLILAAFVLLQQASEEHSSWGRSRQRLNPVLVCLTELLAQMHLESLFFAILRIFDYKVRGLVLSFGRFLSGRLFQMLDKITLFLVFRCGGSSSSS
jgi:hypothetical protein